MRSVPDMLRAVVWSPRRVASAVAATVGVVVIAGGWGVTSCINGAGARPAATSTAASETQAAVSDRDACEAAVDAFTTAFLDRSGTQKVWAANVARTVTPGRLPLLDSVDRAQVPTYTTTRTRVTAQQGACDASVTLVPSGFTLEVEAQAASGVWLVDSWDQS